MGHRIRTAASTDIAEQLPLWPDEVGSENPRYLSEQIITYIGNKRSLLSHIGRAVESVKRDLGLNRIRFFDAFSGSGVVSRYMKAHSSYIVSNDLEDYAGEVARCYLTNRSEVDKKKLLHVVEHLNSIVDVETFPTGFIEDLYAPRDDNKINADDRVFYTKQNARRLDNYRRLLDTLDISERTLLLGPLLSKASIHANTGGVFKGFYKDKHTGIGRFGGSGSNALTRIKGKIELQSPILSRFECDVDVLQLDANIAARKVNNIDLSYIDPPYNQHPYGSNYFMLNLLVNYKRPTELSKVSGIPKDWKRSGYNVRSKSLELLSDLIHTLDSKFLLISFNDEGFIRPDDMHNLLKSAGKVEVFSLPYNTYRGCRNLINRDIHVTEHLYLVRKNC